MKIGIIGPNTLKNASKRQLEERKNNLSKVAEIISKLGFEIVLTPDKKSLLEFFGKEYLGFKGKKIWIVAPMEDDAEKYLNLKIGQIINCNNWYRQPSKFSEESDLYLCIGYSPGVLSEIGASGYFNPKKIIVIRDFISSKLPSEIEYSLKIEYVFLKDLEKSLKI